MEPFRFKISGLFKHFNHSVKLDNDENITIITAPNGYGKSIVLKIIDAIFNSKFIYLHSLNFKSIEMEIGETSIRFEQIQDGGSKTLTVTNLKNRKQRIPFDFENMSKNYDGSKASLARRIPWLERVGPSEWLDRPTGEVIDFDEILNRYGQEFLMSEKYPSGWLREFTSKVVVHMIQDQRLLLRSGLHNMRSDHGRRSEYKNTIDTIEKFAEELASQISNKSAGASEIAQKLDSNFPTRLLRRENTTNTLSVEQLRVKLNEIKEKRDRLSEHSLIASEQHSPLINFGEIKEEDTKVLTLYVNDTEEKLKIYDDILARIELFTEILNKKRLAFKKVIIDREKGFEFITDHAEKLQLTDLSSGEQHEVVLLFELIFRAKNNVLVLIDEPEISLHVAWQKEFLNDLKRIIRLQGLSAIISTHSPQIIDNNWHLVNDLSKGVSE